MPDIMVVFINILIFVLITVFCFILVRILIKHKALSNTFKHAYKLVKKSERSRLENQERVRKEEGKQEKTRFLSKIDILIFRSGLNLVFPFINTETYIIITIIVALLVFFIIQSIYNLLFAVIGILAVIMLAYLVLYFTSGHSYKKTEKTIMNFANLLENYSKTTDDIINIFQKVLPYTQNPVRIALEECCMYAMATGKVSDSLYQLSDKIEHEKFKELIRNLEICSRYEANYAEIITESKRNLREYIAAKEERKAIKQSSKVELLILILASSLILKVITELGERNIMTVLTTTFIGNAILLYCAILIFIIIFMLFSIDK